MKIYDVTRTLASGMYVYPGDPEFVRTPLRSGESYISALALGTHTGTHIDAPAHYFSGAAGVDELLPEKLFTTAELLSFGGLVSETTSAVLFRSGYREGDATYPQLSEEEASALVAAGVTVVGCDTPSIGNDAVHRILLAAGVIVIEMLDFANVADGVYRMIALPLKIAGADAAPARVVLIEEEE
ncbi:cyclase family protein [Methanocorpusculum vombati]|uniref:Cyclase family protein n=1 Tax=Methanocorpusculum vombati TaxID=3002864 RepID=A0ABT4IMI7_9EURY|nr:cyclase family protein [Methanocorpusculum vombati]MCZ9320010.1 cyclase family protein [Methanocorpusculum sp.]MCZ0862963.1 cyclase family protein [Methanocorpusculum vombati]MDE2521366.1 cyclase family protein [Methanocorpusculum sp.]MDE2534535.1 cyclase family protein [Methanocorpusculum sp.]MDE2546968.1 cyclase family protein [Methanocorpusculum sp.]